MPRTTIPLYFPHSQRSIAAYEYLSAYGESSLDRDAVTRNNIIVAVPNPITKGRTVYCEKRPGLVEEDTYVAGGTGSISFTSAKTGTLFGGYITSLVSTLSDGGAIPVGTTDSSGIGHNFSHINECVNANESPNSSVLLISTTNTAGAYYYAQDVPSQDVTFIGTISNGSPIVTAVSGSGAGVNLAYLRVGQRVSGTGIPSGTRILTIDSASQFTMNANASMSDVGMTITRESLAKIMDTHFPAYLGPMVEMDGYIFVATVANTIANSDLGSITSWSASNYIPYSTRAGSLAGLARIRNRLLAFGTGGIEVYRNAGNPDGSPLMRIPEAFISFGPIGGTPNGSPISFPQFCTHRDMVFFACNTLRAGLSGIWAMGADLNPKKISTPTIDRILQPLLAAETTMDVFDFVGQTFLYIGGTSSSPNGTIPAMLYCLDTDEWSEVLFPWNVKFSTGNILPVCVALNNATGNIYMWGEQAEPIQYHDDGTAFTHKIVSDQLALNSGRPFSIRSMRLIGDNQSGGTIQLRTNSKDYDASSWVTRGDFDKTDLSKAVYRCGYVRHQFAFELTDSHDSASRLQAIVIDWEPVSRP